MRRIVESILTAVLLMVLALPALSQQTTSGETQPQPAEQAPVATRPGASQNAQDRSIQGEVSDMLRKHDSFKNVTATVDDRIVLLEGTVPNLRAKDELSRKVRENDKVDGVRNHVTVGGPTVPDAELRNKLADKLRYDRIDRGITFNNLTLGVNNGIVTLGGQVLTDVDRASAVAIVENTPGVKGLVDDVKVLPTSIHDDDIRIATARAIYGDPSMQKYAIDPQAPIRIVVENGHVTLYGVVDNQMDKQIAETRAREVPGVFSVTNKLVVASQLPK